MAHMATLKSINEMRKKYEDLSVVCYVNSTVQLKALSDVCVTSANAVDIVKNYLIEIYFLFQISI